MTKAKKKLSNFENFVTLKLTGFSHPHSCYINSGYFAGDGSLGSTVLFYHIISYPKA